MKAELCSKTSNMYYALKGTECTSLSSNKNKKTKTVKPSHSVRKEAYKFERIFGIKTKLNEG